MAQKSIRKFVSALLSKPFVILTGNSGTGKTRMAIKFAEALESATSDIEWEELTVDQNGRITDKLPEHIKDLCRDTNEYEAQIEGKNVSVKIEMSSFIESDDLAFKQTVKNNSSSKVRLKIAENAAEKRHLLVPVGADWTDSHHLLGYINPFGPGGEKTYEVTSALRLILRAAEPANCELPFFLILDEMNLSHVERYFSTFLSVMEADRSSDSAIPIIDYQAIKLITKVLSEDGNESSEGRMASALSNRGEPLCLPQNLFIIGTVNVDETTYMFSPKVLDRAHVIELHTETPSSYASGSKSEDLAGKKSDEILKHFAAAIIKRRKKNFIGPFETLKASTTDQKRYNEIENTVNMVLDGLYSLLEPVGFDFGYRTINEFLDYISVWESFEPGGDWKTAVDKAVLQKVLPKIHGNRRQLGDCLKALELFFTGKGSKYTVGQHEPIAEATGIELKESLAKISRMVRSLEYTGYTSFIS